MALSAVEQAVYQGSQSLMLEIGSLLGVSSLSPGDLLTGYSEAPFSIREAVDGIVEIMALVMEFYISSIMLQLPVVWHLY